MTTALPTIASDCRYFGERVFGVAEASLSPEQRESLPPEQRESLASSLKGKVLAMTRLPDDAVDANSHPFHQCLHPDAPAGNMVVCCHNCNVNCKGYQKPAA